MNAELKEHNFTGDLMYVADTISIEAAQAMLNILPGIEVKVPKVWSENSPLCLLPKHIAEKIIATFPGDVFYIPTGKVSTDTRKKVVQLRKDGKTNTAIALELHITERHVRGLLNSGPRLPRHHDPRQIDMFAKPDAD